MKIDNRQRALLLAALALLALLVADQVVIEPLRDAWAARAERATTLRKNLTEGTQLRQREAALRRHWRQMQTNALPDNSSLAEQQVLKAIDGWAQECRVLVTGITPQWKRDADEYRTLGCRVDATGDLTAVTRFLHAIEISPLPLKLESVELVALDANGQNFSLGLRLSGLVLTPGGSR